MLYLLPFTIIVSAFILDRIAKEWVLRTISYGDTLSIFPFFQLTYIENSGMAFGMGQNKNTFFLWTTITLMLFLFFLMRRYKTQLYMKIGLALVLSGALGNLYDRIVFGSVIDFLDFYIQTHHWPAFNIADSAICIGAFFIFLSEKFPQKNKPQTF